MVKEAVHAVYPGALVAATQEEEIFRPAYLVAKEKHEDFDAVLSKIDVIAEEEVVAFRREASKLEKPQEISNVPVDVA